MCLFLQGSGNPFFGQEEMRFWLFGNQYVKNQIFLIILLVFNDDICLNIQGFWKNKLVSLAESSDGRTKGEGLF